MAKSAAALIGLAICLLVVASSSEAQSTQGDGKGGQAIPSTETYQTLYITNLNQTNELNDLVADLRNMLPRAKVYLMLPQSAISIRATPEDIQLAQKIVADFDRAKRSYRLTYTITETDGGKRIGSQHFTLLAVSGGKATLKQGKRVPVFVGTNDAKSAAQNIEVQYVGAQVQYADVGLKIEASVDGSAGALRLTSKVEQSSVSEDKSGVGPQDPIISQTVLEGASMLVEGKPLVLGSLDIPGSTRHQDIEVVAELIR